jgi:hypothetical protein
MSVLIGLPHERKTSHQFHRTLEIGHLLCEILPDLSVRARHAMRTVGTDPPWTAQQQRSRWDCLERSHGDMTGKSGRPLRRCSTSPTLRVATTSTPRHGYQR